jgi:hypothetical protein
MSAPTPLTWHRVCQELLQAAGMPPDSPLLSPLLDHTSPLGQPDATMFTSDDSPLHKKLINLLQIISIVIGGGQLPQKCSLVLLHLMLVLSSCILSLPLLGASLAAGFVCCPCRQLVLCSVP